MKKAVFAVIVISAATISFTVLSKSRNQDISDSDVDLLKNSIIITSLSMDSDESPSDGLIIFDDGFDVNSNSELDMEKKSKPEAVPGSGKSYFKELKKSDLRWHIVNHKIKRNENLISIAKMYNSNLTHIAKYNSIKNDSPIKAGDRIGVPTRRGIVHTVASGDTLTSISRRYNSSLSSISDTNKMGQNIFIGEKIFIPDGVLLTEKGKRNVSVKSDDNRESVSLKNRNEEKRTKISGSFMCPVSGRLTSNFGIRRDPISGKRKFHNGIDISCAENSIVKCAADGKVIFAGTKDGYGNMMIVEHDNSIITVYAHLNSFNFDVGNFVKRGDIIARSGATGVVTGPHLHFEIRKDYTTALNPSRMFRR